MWFWVLRGEIMPIFTFKAKLNQERALARMVEVKADKGGVWAVVMSDNLKGYVFIEGESQHQIEEAMKEVRPIRGRALFNREVPIEELLGILTPKPTIDSLQVGDTVEIVDGPFKGFRAKLLNMDSTNQDIQVSLQDANMSFPVKIHADYVKKVASEEESDDKFAL